MRLEVMQLCPLGFYQVVDVTEIFAITLDETILAPCIGSPDATMFAPTNMNTCINLVQQLHTVSLLNNGPPCRFWRRSILTPPIRDQRFNF